MKQQVLSWLADNVPASRIEHILGVEQTAIELAQIYHQDESKASVAALMHDLAKYFKPKLLLQIAQEQGLEIDAVMMANPHLLHADVSAIVAKEEFGVRDEEVLQAIANHTLGRPEMSCLSCIVFIADSIEPNRGNTAELEVLRQQARQNLDQTLWLTCDYSLKYLLNTRKLIHPRTIATRNWAVLKASQETKEMKKI